MKSQVSYPSRRYLVSGRCLFLCSRSCFPVPSFRLPSPQDLREFLRRSLMSSCRPLSRGGLGLPLQDPSRAAGIFDPFPTFVCDIVFTPCFLFTGPPRHPGSGEGLRSSEPLRVFASCLPFVPRPVSPFFCGAPLTCLRFFLAQ